MNRYGKLEEIVGKDKIKYNEKMSKYATMKVGGPCDCIVFPDAISKIKDVIDFCKNENIAFYVIGNGSNLLVKDEGIHGVVIKLGHRFSKIEQNGEYILAYSGATMPAISQLAKKNSLKGLEFACGIPGTIGGGVKMNAGAYGGDMSGVVSKVTALTQAGEICEIDGKDMKFAYRHSIIEENDLIVLEVVIELKHGDMYEINCRMKELSDARRSKQPLEYPSAGSTFKRPEGYFAGKLIEDAGLRGFRVGDAQVSEKHCGFVINKENATATDVVNLIHDVQRIVYEKFQVQLDSEVKFLGEF